jgi:PAS domain S-box-containing protein
MADAALRTSEVRYRRLFEAAHDGVLIVDPGTRKIVDANPFMTTLLGYARDHLIGMELYQIGFLADAQASRDMFQTLTATRQVRYENLPLQTQEGGLREVEVVANLYDEAGRAVVQCNVRDITERRKTETELRDRHHLLNRIFEVLPGVLYVFDLDENRVVFVNNTAEMTYSPEEIAGMGADAARNLMHPDDQPRFQEHIARIRTLGAGATAAFEYRMRDKAGEWRWYMSTDTVFLRDASGAARQFIGVAPEITDRKRAEFALRESEARQAFLLSLSDRLRPLDDARAISSEAARILGEGLCVARSLYYEIDKGDYVTTADYSRGVPSLVGRYPTTSFGHNLLERQMRGETIVVPDVALVHSADEARGFADMQIGAYVGVPLVKNGHFVAGFAVHATTPRVWTPGEVSLVEEIAERTWAAVERARAEAALHAAHDTFRHLVNRSPFGVYVIDADFRLIQISDGGQKAFGNVRPLIGRDFTEVVHAVWPEPFASEVIARFRHTLATGEPFKAETNERRADIEATEAYDWKIERVILPDGRFGVVCHFYDLSERKRHEEHIQLLMKEVNHRSKNMLGLVQAVAQQTAKTSPDDFVTRFGERIHALAAAQDLLVKSEWKSVSLNGLIRSQLAHFQDLIGDRIQLHGPDILILPAAAQSIGMAVHEMATNAGKYGALSNQTGRVEVAWERRAGQGGAPQFVMSWIECSGPSVIKPTRRGFGSTVIGVMVKMSLACEAEIDYAPTGFRWRIAGPANNIMEKAEAAKARPAPQSIKAAATGSKRVLVVEDEALIAIEIADILSDAGFTVIGPVGSVAHALALIERSGCEAAVLDINLGDGTSEPIARVLSASATPFVTISGYSREQQPAAFKNAPLVSKPVRPELLIAEITKCLNDAY